MAAITILVGQEGSLLGSQTSSFLTVALFALMGMLSKHYYPRRLCWRILTMHALPTVYEYLITFEDEVRM